VKAGAPSPVSRAPGRIAIIHPDDPYPVLAVIGIALSIAFGVAGGFKR
jgi:hypothetical protein